jgi:hypothetical protein
MEYLDRLLQNPEFPMQVCGLAALFCALPIIGIVGLIEPHLKSRKLHPHAERELRKHEAWMLYHGGYELTPEQRQLLRLDEQDRRDGER